jgi:hypothetical protein
MGSALASYALPKRGQTFYKGVTPPSIFTVESTKYEGTLQPFKDIDPTTVAVGAKTYRSNRDVICRLVRNVSTIALREKRLVTFASGYWNKRVDGYATLNNAANVAGVVDEFLSAGIPANDMGWVVVNGPTLVKTPLGADATNVFSEGTLLLALTAATSQATTAGRVQPFYDTSVVTDATNQLKGVIGVALSAKTTANTNVDILCDIQILKGVCS